MKTQDYSAIQLPTSKRTKMEPVMRSWKTVYKEIRLMRDSESNLAVLSEMLAYELDNDMGPRAQVLTRLHMRINAMRQRLEYSKIIQNAKR